MCIHIYSSYTISYMRLFPKEFFPCQEVQIWCINKWHKKKVPFLGWVCFRAASLFFVTFYVQHLVYWTYFSLIHFEFTFYRIAYETCAFYELAQHNIICCIIWRLPKNYFINCMWLIPPLPSTYGKHLEKMQFNWTNECWEKSIGKPYVYRIRTWMKCTI